MGGEDKVPTCTSRILEGRSGTQGNGSGERIAKSPKEFYNKTPSHDTRHGTGAHWH